MSLAEEVIFTASAQAGEANRIGVYGMAGSQYVATESTPVEALMAQVLDAQDNPVAGAPVEFRVSSGDAIFGPASAPGGTLGSDGQSITVLADRNGIAVARPRSGDTPGTVTVQAEVVRADDSRIGGAAFQLEVLAAQDGPTSLSGIVMDHSGSPLANIRLSIARTPLSVLSNEAGYFEFPSQVPAGKIDLFVDGREVRFQRGGAQFEYPALHFETAVVQGQTNQLPHAIYLPPVETSRAVVVGGDADVTLSLPGFEGFEMRVRANSVTFPDGSREGPLVVSAVHADRLPMVPPGMAGRFVAVGWTIQPTGTRFDPPIEVRIPNADGLRPGRTLPILQWDHDLATFVPMGNGTVSEDGTQIVSDPGSGITKAGWGGGGPPPPPDNCGSDGGQPHISEIRVKAFGTEQESDTPLLLLTDQPSVNADAKGLMMEVDAENCPVMDVGWDLGNGRIVEDTMRITLAELPDPGTYSVTPFVECKRELCGETVSDGADGEPRDVHIVRLKLESGFSEQTQNPQANGWKRGLANDNATGFAERPYALMGVRSDDRGCVRLEFTLEGSDTGKSEVRDRLKFGLGRGASVLGDSGPDCMGAGALENDVAFLSIEAPPFVSMWPLVGLDDNGDDQLDFGEAELHKYGWLYLMVSNATRDQALADYTAAASNFGPLGQNWLAAFRDGGIPGTGTSVDESFTISRAEPGLAHANGARFPPGAWNPAKRGESRRVTHPASSFVVQALMDSPNMAGWLAEGVVAHRGEILGAAIAAGNSVTVDYVFTNDPTVGALHTLDKATFWRSGTGGVQGGSPGFPNPLPYPDLYAAVGDAQSLTLNVRLQVHLDTSSGLRLDIESIRVLGGTAYDLFDFDLDVRILGLPVGAFVPSLGPLARAGAKFQGAHLGKGTSRPGGLVFQNVYVFGSRTFPGFTLIQLTER